MSLRIFEELRIRNIEKSKIIKLILKHKKRAVKEIKESELRCYDYSDVEDLLYDINEDILTDQHWKKQKAVSNGKS